MDDPYVLVSSQGLVVAGQRSEEPLHETMIESNIPVVKPEDYRCIRMIRPSFRIERNEHVVAGVEVRYDVSHVKRELAVEIVGGLVAMKEAKANACRQSGSAIELGRRPGIVPRLQLQCLRCKVLLQFLQRALHVIDSE